MKKILWYLTALSILGLIITSYSYSQTNSYRLISYKDVKHELTGNNYPNVLKTYDMAIDQGRNRAYVTSILTPYAAIIDLNTKTEVGSVSYPFGGAFLLTSVSVNPANGYLLMSWIEDTIPKQYLVNPDNSQNLGTYYYSSTRASTAFDSLRNRVLIGDGTKIKILSGSNLSAIDSVSAGFTIGSIATDSAYRFMYVTSKSPLAGNTVVKVFSLNSPYALSRTINIPYASPLGVSDIDSARGKLILRGINDIVIANINTGAVINSKFLSSAPTGTAYQRNTQIYYLINPNEYSHEGQGGAWGKLYIYNTVSGTLDSMKKGDKSYPLQIQKSTNKLVWCDMHSGYLEMYNTSSGAIDSVHYAVSLDYLDHSPDGDNVFMVSRLGGSDVIKYNISSQTFTKFKAGNWPSVVKVDSSTNKMYVYNHFQSSISVFNAGTNALLTTIELPINEGRTDAIPTMEIDRVNKKIYVAVPEFQKMCVVNMLTNNVDNTIDLTGYNYTDGGGVGYIQMMPAPDFNKLFVLYKNQRKMKIYNTATYTNPDSMTFGTLWSDTTSLMSESVMTYDSVSNRLFMGNIVINSQTNAIAGTVPKSSKILGYKKDRSKMYGITIVNDTIKIYEHLPASPYTVTATKVLFKRHAYIPNFDYDANKNDFYIAEFNYGLFRHYDLDSSVVSSVGNTVLIPHEFTLKQNYPNPFNPTTKIGFSLPVSMVVSIDIYDNSGRLIEKLINNQTLPAGEYIKEFDGGGLASGIYYYRIQANEFAEVKKMVLLK